MDRESRAVARQSCRNNEGRRLEGAGSAWRTRFADKKHWELRSGLFCFQLLSFKNPKGRLQTTCDESPKNKTPTMRRTGRARPVFISSLFTVLEPCSELGKSPYPISIFLQKKVWFGIDHGMNFLGNNPHYTCPINLVEFSEVFC